MKFTIDNKSKYRTRHLRAFVVRSYKIARQHAGPQRVARVEAMKPRITIRFARANHRGKHGTTGHAYFYGRAHIGVGDEVSKRELAYVIAHEFGHVLGLRHSEMSGGPLMHTTPEQSARLYGWADALPLDPKPAKLRRETRDQRRAALVARLERWQAKQRRAQNAVKRLQNRIRAHDRYSAKPALAA